MTKSDFIRKRAQPLIRMVQKHVHEEERDNVATKIEIWLLRLITDVQQLGPIELDTASLEFPYTEPEL